MNTFPTTFPLDSATQTWTMLRTGEALTKRRTFAEHAALNLGAYFGGLVLHDDGTVAAACCSTADPATVQAVDNLEAELNSFTANRTDAVSAGPAGIGFQDILPIITTLLELIRQWRKR